MSFINKDDGRGKEQLVQTILETEIKKNGVFAKASPTILRKKVTVGDHVSGLQMRNFNLSTSPNVTDADDFSTLPRSTQAYAAEPEIQADLTIAG